MYFEARFIACKSFPVCMQIDHAFMHTSLFVNVALCILMILLYAFRPGIYRQMAL